jgi:type I restriction enzyme, R subunit
MARDNSIIEHDFLTGLDNEIQNFPKPSELWDRLRAAENISESMGERLLTPYYHLSGKSPRYYQEIAINGAVRKDYSFAEMLAVKAPRLATH